MKKTSIIFVIIILIFMVSGCSKKDVIKHDYKFEGENDYWSAIYKVNGKDIFTEKNGKIDCKSNSDNSLIVTFKKDLSELSTLKHIEISYKSILSEGKLTEDYSESPPIDGTFTLNSSSNTSVKEKEDTVIKVIINIDGDIQVINLEYDK